MSIYSDYEVGAMDDYEYREACKRENRRERYYDESDYDLVIDDEWEGDEEE